MKISTYFAGALMMGVSAFAMPTRAADLVAIDDAAPVAERMAPESHWSIDPFIGWLPGMKGNVAVFGASPVSIDITAWDLIQNLDELLHALDGIYIGQVAYNNGQFGFQADLFYLALSQTKNFGGVLNGALDASFSYTYGTVAGTYRIYDTPTTTADVLAGARFSKVDIGLDVSLLGRSRSFSDGGSWVDPVIGIQGQHYLDPHWYVKGNALYGGFGVASDNLWDLAGYVGYDFGNGVELYGGWRASHDDYQDGSFEWDMTLSGPVVSLTIKF